MLLPISWLKSLVDLNGIDDKTIEDGLFSCGLEVEEKLPFAPNVSGIVAGKIISTKKHENSDHLTICILDCGSFGKEIQIVTGADNIKVGDLVPVALNGANVIGRDGEKITIKNGKLRGVESNGMLCSGEELGIDDDWYDGASVDGILILKDDCNIGEDIKEYLELNDEVWDISVTANLPHCQYVFGVARELAALLDRSLKEPEIDFEIAKEDSLSIDVEVEAEDLCPRYMAHLIKDVKVEPSPVWMRRHLLMCDHKPFNTIVDITNYVLTEMGQPMHAFDLKDIGGGKIIVRRAKDGETITTLDEAEFKLNNENLMICDISKPIALAGIMGGLNSGILETTENVVFESAKFLRENIRRTSRSLGQASDSSRRFEKGVDEYTAEKAMHRALHLVQKLGCGKPTSVCVDVYATKDKRNKAITTSFEKINSVLGLEISKTEVIEILKRMAYEVSTNGEEITAVAPPYRDDVEDFPDLAEDVIKMYGYEHIVPSLMKNASITAGGLSKKQLQEQRLKRSLTIQGLSELIHYSFYSKTEIDKLNLEKDASEYNLIEIMNPISEKYSIMRSILMPSMLMSIAHNLKRGNAEARFFELANIFVPKSLPIKELPLEIPMLSFGLFGKDENFFTAKGVIESIANEFDLNFSYKRISKPYLHPNASAEVFLNGESIGFFGQISYEVAENFEISQNAYIGEISYQKIAAEFKEIQKFNNVSRFPEVRRDLALIASEEITCGEIEEVIYSSCKYVSEIKLFDIYRSIGIGEGKKSMAFNIVFSPEDEQLMPEMIDGFVSKILKSLDKRLSVNIR